MTRSNCHKYYVTVFSYALVTYYYYYYGNYIYTILIMGWSVIYTKILAILMKVSIYDYFLLKIFELIGDEPITDCYKYLVLYLLYVFFQRFMLLMSKSKYSTVCQFFRCNFRKLYNALIYINYGVTKFVTKRKLLFLNKL